MSYTLTKEQLHNLRARIGEISQTCEVLYANCNADGKKWALMHKRKVSEALEVLDSIAKSDVTANPIEEANETPN